MLREPITGGQRVRDYTVGFRYQAHLFRHALDAALAKAGEPRFALVVVDRDPATAEREPQPVLTVTAEPAVSDSDDHEIVLRNGTTVERQGSYDAPGDIEVFVERAAQLVCERLGVDRGTFRPVPGSEPPPPWQQTPADARLCRVCGQALPADAEHCQYCGAEAKSGL